MKIKALKDAIEAAGGKANLFDISTALGSFKHFFTGLGKVCVIETQAALDKHNLNQFKKLCDEYDQLSLFSRAGISFTKQDAIVNAILRKSLDYCNITTPYSTHSRTPNLATALHSSSTKLHESQSQMYTQADDDVSHLSSSHNRDRIITQEQQSRNSSIGVANVSSAPALPTRSVTKSFDPLDVFF